MKSSPHRSPRHAVRGSVAWHPVAMLLTLALLVTVSRVATAAEDALQLAYNDTLKGGSQLSDPRDVPEKHLGLLPPAESSTDETPGPPVCTPELAAAPMVIGTRDQYAKLGGLVKSVGMGLLAKALSSATGGAVQSGGKGKEAPQPALHEDPIKKKFRTKIKDKASGARLNLGGQLAQDGLLLSTRLDDADDKGTLHEIYLEREDCRRIYPFLEYSYELWGKWNLSVSWTKTTSTYQDGKLIDRQTSSGGFTRSGDARLLASGGEILPLSEALAKAPPELRGEIEQYQARLRSEIGAPMWQRNGFGAPTSGARSVGTAYKLSAADRAAIESGRMRAVVQITRESGPVFEAFGIPVALSPGAEGHLAFAALGGR